MSNFRKMLTAVTVIAVLLSTAVVIGAAGNGEISVTSKSVSKNELELKLSNTSDYYLGNVNIKVSSASGSSTKVTSFGISGSGKSGVDTIRSVAPDGSVSLFVKLSGGSGSGEQTKPPANTTTGKNPVNTTTGKNPANDDPTPVIPGVTDNTQESEEADATVTGDGTGETEKDTDDTEKDIGTEDSEASLEESVDSAEKDEAVTDGADSDSDEGGGSAVGWIIAGAVAAAVAAGTVVFVVLKKKKNAVKNISSVIVIAVLLGVLASANGVSAADAVASPTPGSVTETVTLANGDSITVTAEYTVAPAPVVQAIKNKRRAPSTEECNNGNTPASAIYDGAGPLTGFNIYVGKNNMMFFGDAIKDYKGQTLMGNARLNKLSGMMNDRDAWAKENGIKLYLVIVPNKTTVYPDYVPSSVRAGAKTNADAVVEHLAANSTVEVIDLRATVKNARSTYGDNLFYKYDTHWNYNAGFVAYSEMIRRIKEDMPGVYTLGKNDYSITEAETYMKDMAWYLGHYNAYQDYGPVYTLKSGMTATMKSMGEYEWNGQFRYSSKWTDGYSDSLKKFSYENEFNVGAPSVYMYRDSFSLAMVHFIKDSFYKSSFNWSYEFNKTEVLRSGANVVIMEVVEKQLLEFTNSRTFTN